MAITYGFYNSMNGDRKYDAVQLSSIFDGVIRDGVFQSIGGYLATKPGRGMQVIVAPGKAWFDHTWTVNDADLPLDISQSDLTLSRYDAVVLETDATKAVRKNSIKVIKGTPASDPKKPTLVNEGDVHQHPLAYILVPGGSTEIQVQNIDIMVGKSECPFVTSILESVSIEALLEKWEGEFRVWFDELQNQLSGDVATNLQNQINKINQTTATEETKSLYKVPSDGTPDDVFQAINSIGDIKISTRTDLGDSWLLCNGETFSPEKYPELAETRDTKAVPWREVSLNSPEGDSRFVSEMCYANGHWFISYWGSGGNKLYVSDSPEGPWEESTIDGYVPHYIIYANGAYYGSGKTSLSGLTKSTSEKGPWKHIKISNLKNATMCSNLFSVGEKLYAFTSKSDWENEFYLSYADLSNPEVWTQTPMDTAPARSEQNNGPMTPIAVSNDMAFVGIGAGSYFGSRKSFYVSTGQTSPVATSDGNIMVGKSADGWIRGNGSMLGVSNTPDSPYTTEFGKPQKASSAQCIELGRFVVSSFSDGSIEVMDKRLKKSSGVLTSVALNGMYAVSDGTIIAVPSKNKNKILIATEAELTQGLLPTINIPGAYAYIRGK